MSDFKALDQNEEENDVSRILTDLRYICKSTSLITDSLQNGLDIVQMPNGDVIVTEVKTINILYSWDHKKNKMVRVSQH